jgi:outer membrane protein
MKRFIIFALITVVVCAGISYAIVEVKSKQKKMGWVSLSDLFNDFALKKELEMKLKKVKDQRQGIIDSLEFNLRFLSKQIQAEQQKDKDKITTFELKRDEYIQKKKQFDEDNDAVAKQYDSQIISQMNQYVKDFGTKHGYTYIFGADGSGFLMYSLEADNITKEVKTYINDRYKGNTE